MSQVLYVNDRRRDAIIADAARRRTPVVLTRQEGGGWKTYKARLLGCSEQDRQVYIEQPAGGSGGPGLAPLSGELLGVAFRRGHKKCLFNAVVRRCPEDQTGGSLWAFAVEWPEDMQELQRRVYQRACPPPERSIQVRFWVGAPGSAPERGFVGVMQDLSAGGVRVRCTKDDGLRVGDNVKITFTLRSCEPEFRLEGVFRHCQSMPDGACSLGFQFLGLETSRDGHETLVRLARTVTDLQRAAVRRCRPRLRPTRLRG